MRNSQGTLGLGVTNQAMISGRSKTAQRSRPVDYLPTFFLVEGLVAFLAGLAALAGFAFRLLAAFAGLAVFAVFTIVFLVVLAAMSLAPRRKN